MKQGVLPLVLAALFSASAASAADVPTDQETVQNLCAGALELQDPVFEGVGTLDELRAREHCEPLRLYYGLDTFQGIRPDLAEAWKCAMSRVSPILPPLPCAESDSAAVTEDLLALSEGEVLEPPPQCNQPRFVAMPPATEDDHMTLAMLYANGGVPHLNGQRDYGLALKHVCQAGGTPTEKLARVARLITLQGQGNKGGQFDECDDATSTQTLYRCATRAETWERALFRGIDLERTSKMAPSFRPAYQALKGALETYLTTVSQVEVIRLGNSTHPRVVNVRRQLDTEFLDTLDALRLNRMVPRTPSDLSFADTLMQRLAGELRRSLPPAVSVSSKAHAPDELQPAWREYIEAWVAFAQEAYPDVSEASIRAHLTWQRITLLQSMLP